MRGSTARTSRRCCVSAVATRRPPPHRVKRLAAGPKGSPLVAGTRRGAEAFAPRTPAIPVRGRHHLITKRPGKRVPKPDVDEEPVVEEPDEVLDADALLEEEESAVPLKAVADDAVEAGLESDEAVRRY